MVSIVIRPSIGSVPEWLETTRAPPSAGRLSTPRTSIRNHFSRERPQRGEQQPLGDLGVEAVLVDLVVAGQPAPQERQEPGELRLPVVAEDLGGARLERGQPLAGRDAGERRAVARSCVGRRTSVDGDLGGRRRRRRPVFGAGLAGAGRPAAGQRA